jgi:hypothetical protein
MRSNVQAKDSEQVFARIGGEILDLAPGLTPYYPFDAGEDPGDLTLERGNVGKVIYYTVNGHPTWGTVYGGAGLPPRYYDRSTLRSAAVHAGIVPAGEQGVVKITILPYLPGYIGSNRNDVNSQDQSDPDAGSVSFTVEPAYP